MSRSYKKHPTFKITTRDGKREAARAFRRFKGDVSNGRFYRKVYESYDVIDWIFRAYQEEHEQYKRYRELGRKLRHTTGTEEELEEYLECARVLIYFLK